MARLESSKSFSLIILIGVQLLLNALDFSMFSVRNMVANGLFFAWNGLAE
jgi:hypothetical protein